MSIQIVQLNIDLEATFDQVAAIPIAEAAPLLRGRRGPPSPTVVQRWANPKRGCMIGENRLVLPAVRIGGRLLTMVAWVEAFAKRRTQLGMRPSPPQVRPKRSREADQRRATERLRRAGIAD